MGRADPAPAVQGCAAGGLFVEVEMRIYAVSPDAQKLRFWWWEIGMEYDFAAYLKWTGWLAEELDDDD